MKKFFSNLYRKIATVLAFSMLATVAHAGAYNCNAALSGVGVYSDGKVFIHQGYAWVYVCNMTTQGSFTMSTDACKAAYSTFVLARATGAAVDIYYNNAATCATLSAWTAYNDVYAVDGPN